MTWLVTKLISPVAALLLYFFSFVGLLIALWLKALWNGFSATYSQSTLNALYKSISTWAVGLPFKENVEASGCQALTQGAYIFYNGVYANIENISEIFRLESCFSEWDEI